MMQIYSLDSSQPYNWKRKRRSVVTPNSNLYNSKQKKSQNQPFAMTAEKHIKSILTKP